MNNTFGKEACYVYSIPKSSQKEVVKKSTVPGPGSYDPNINTKLKAAPKIK